MILSLCLPVLVRNDGPNTSIYQGNNNGRHGVTGFSFSLESYKEKEVIQ